MIQPPYSCKCVEPVTHEYLLLISLFTEDFLFSMYVGVFIYLSIISRVFSISENLKIHHLLNCSLALEYTFLNAPLFSLYVFTFFLGLRGYNFCDYGDSFTKGRFLNRILCIRMGIQQDNQVLQELQK